jgi:hypothetical protein
MLKLTNLYLGAIFLLLVFILFSCKNDKNNEKIPNSKNIREISLNPKNKVQFSDLATDLEYVVLESLPDYFVASIDKIEVYNSRIFILSKIQKTILIFSNNGEIISKISDFGEGPGKYSGISDFIVDDNFIYLLTSPSKFVYKYDSNGKLIQVIPTNDNYIYEFYPVKDGWITHLKDAFDRENEFNIVKWDSTFSNRQKEFLFIESERRNNSLAVDNYISKYKNSLFIVQNFSNQVFEFIDDSLFLSFKVLIDQQSVDDKYMKMFISNPNRAVNFAIEENIFTGFKKILSTDEVLFLESMKGAGTVSSFISIRSGKSISYFALDFKFDFGIAGNVIGTDGNKFIMQISENILNQLKDLDFKGEINETNLKNDAIREIIGQYEKEGNPVLVFFSVNFDKL